MPGEVAAFLRAALARGLSIDAALAALRRYGTSPAESVRAVREVRGGSPGKVKRLVACAPAWEDLRGEHQRLAEEIVAVFETGA